MAGKPDSAACFPGPLVGGGGDAQAAASGGSSSSSETSKREHCLFWIAFQFSLPAGACSPSLSSQYSLAKATLAYEEGGPSFCFDNRMPQTGHISWLFEASE